MAHSNTVLNQLPAHINRHEFDQLAARHHQGQEFRAYTRWSQFLAMLTGGLSGRKRLRDLTGNLRAQGKHLYGLGIKQASTATLARINAQQPASLYQENFAKLLQRCPLAAPMHCLSFQRRFYLLDATTTCLCLAAFPWIGFRQKKGDIELHVGLNPRGCPPVFPDMTKARVHETNRIGSFRLPKGSFACFDRGVTDYGWCTAPASTQPLFKKGFNRPFQATTSSTGYFSTVCTVK